MHQKTRRKTSKLVRNISKKIGLSPGTMLHVGEKKVDNTKIYLFDYDAENLQEKELTSIEQAFEYRDHSTVSWINIDGLHDLELIEKINTHFGIHPLVSSDIVNTGQRPKLEDFGDYFFVTLKMLSFSEENHDVNSEQISLIVGPNYVISFQEQPGDVFEHIRNRIRSNKGRIRKLKSDYLMYSIIDAIVDHYFYVLEKTGELVEQLEDDIMLSTEPGIPQNIHHLKRTIIYKRKLIAPIRELINGLLRTESGLIKKETHAYLRDIYDHTIQILDTIESYRDILSGMHDIYLSNVGNKMNEIMKVLTIFAAIFIPLTFMAGVYGMNFEYMPELKWKYGYFVLLGTMLALFVGMVAFFRRKKWL